MIDTSFNIAVFVCCNDYYVTNAIITLESVKEKNRNKYSNIDYFIVGNISDKLNLSLIEKHNINFIFKDYSPLFNRNDEMDWPNQCFWILACPELFEQLEYDYCCALDGDVLCTKPLDLSWLPLCNHIAGIKNYKFERGQFRKLNDERKQEVLNILNYHDKDIGAYSTNTGAVWFNCKGMKEISFLDMCLKNYKALHGYYKFMGDQILLETTAPLLEWYYLEPEWNYRMNNDNPNYNPTSLKDNDPFFVHFVGCKPWTHSLLWSGWHTNKGFRNEPVRKYYVNAWRSYATMLFPKAKGIFLKDNINRLITIVRNTLTSFL